MLRAPLWQEAEKGKPVSPQILNVRRLLGTEVAVWSPQLLALPVTSRQWNSRIQCWQVGLSQLRRPELQLW